jgi:hypothetical protein
LAKTTQFDKLRKSRRRKRFFRRALGLLAALLIAAACLSAFAVIYQLDLRSGFENVLASMKRGPGFPVSLSEMNVHSLIPMGGDVAVFTSAGTYFYNTSGARMNSCLTSYRTPQAKAAGGKLLTYDLGGNGLRVDNKAKNLYNETAAGTLLAADLSETGALAVVETTPGATALVSAYNPRFELMYSWTVQDSYITGVSLSRRGEMMSCAGLTMEGQHILSLLRIHHFDQDEEAAKVPLSDEVIASMVWTDVGEIQVVTDKNLYLFSKEGEQLAKAALPGQPITFENIPGAVYIACGDHRDPGGITVLAYDGSLKQVGSASISRRLLSLNADGDHLLVLAEGELYLADPLLREMKPRGREDLYQVTLAGNHIYGLTPDGLIWDSL